MGKYRFEAIVEWKKGEEHAKNRNIPIEYFVAGDGVNASPAMRSDYATDPAQLLFVEEVIDQNEAFTLVFPVTQVSQFSRPNWEMTAIILGAFEGKRHVRSSAYAFPKRQMLVTDKGKQKMTFKYSIQGEYLP